ncbi:hypothetical protein CBR_g46714 [Chara braunii]|uniref:Galactinol--sucrose galactosyltransferase n=1 Tax=Chara braunii TaxID=69332 RepID=A0A388K407_CHABU|nr:hypothetical protein CBR_g46714 [Chara braunii]|eukprot:GBG64756.1 hypothetical protein CBR_g46714 [Chara braunii]
MKVVQVKCQGSSVVASGHVSAYSEVGGRLLSPICAALSRQLGSVSQCGRRLSLLRSRSLPRLQLEQRSRGRESRAKADLHRLRFDCGHRRLFPMAAVVNGCSEAPMRPDSTSSSESKSNNNYLTFSTGERGGEMEDEVTGLRRREDPLSIEIADAKLTVGGKTILTGVPGNIVLSPNSTMSGITSAFLGARFDRSDSRHVAPLGILRGLRFLSLYRFKLWWAAPHMGSEGRDVPVETVFLLLEGPEIEGQEERKEEEQEEEEATNERGVTVSDTTVSDNGCGDVGGHLYGNSGGIVSELPCSAGPEALSVPGTPPCGPVSAAAAACRDITHDGVGSKESGTELPCSAGPGAHSVPGTPPCGPGPAADRDGTLDDDAVRSKERVHVLLLPILEGAFRACLNGNERDEVEICLESGDPSVEGDRFDAAVCIACGRNPFELITEAVKAVEVHSEWSFLRRERKQSPGSLDYFGWCTWDALYLKVDVEGIREGLSSLAKGGTPARFLLIDDGWHCAREAKEQDELALRAWLAKANVGDQHLRRLVSIRCSSSFLSRSVSDGESVREEEELKRGGVQVQENEKCQRQKDLNHSEERRMGGLGAEDGNEEECEKEVLESAVKKLDNSFGDCIRRIKEDFNVKYVYAWQSIIGYWGGVCPDSPEMAKFMPSLRYPVLSPGVLHNQPDLAVDRLARNGLGLIPPTKAFEFFNELHSYLSASGVDGVKVDVTNILETLGRGYGGRVKLTRAYHKALDESVRKNFPDNGCIVSMAHSTDGMYTWKSTAVVRASDDFWPEDPAAHSLHVSCVAYNTLFFGEFMYPDWDMFQTDHPTAVFHAACRALGGCPVYVSDKIGRHDFSVLRSLVLPDGRILRARLPGRPTRDCLFDDPTRDGRSLLKIWNINAAGGVVGAFNCQGSRWCKDSLKYVFREDVGHVAPSSRVSGRISAADVDCLHTIVNDLSWKGDTAVYSYRQGTLAVLPRGKSIAVSLERQDFDIFTIAPVRWLPVPAQRANQEDSEADRRLSVPAQRANQEDCEADVVVEYLQFAPVGLVDMFNSGGAILFIRYESSIDSRLDDSDGDHSKEGGSNQREGGGRKVGGGGSASGESRASDSAAAVAGNQIDNGNWGIDDPSPLLPRAPSAAAADRRAVEVGCSATVTMAVRGYGRFVAFSSRKPTACFIDTFPIPFSFSAEDGRLSVQLSKPHSGHVWTLKISYF